MGASVNRRPDLSFGIASVTLLRLPSHQSLFTSHEGPVFNYFKILRSLPQLVSYRVRAITQK